jgi:hypothetical protein
MATATSVTTTTWKIVNLSRETIDGYVYEAHYTVDSKDDTYSAGAYGSIGFERPEGKLIPFADLTEGIVVQWLLDALGEKKVTSICEALQSQLDEQRAPSKAAGVPWTTAVAE